MSMIISGRLSKLVGTLPASTDTNATVKYALPLGHTLVPLNVLLGQPLTLRFTGSIQCKHCGRPIKKTYNQGYCFPCFRSLAECDICIVKPELCHHFTKDTCRDKTWALTHCMQPHIVYLANTSGLKVGITRISQVPVRWIDQGAVQALPIFQVANRYQSGLVEVILAKHVSDKTNWRTLLRSPPIPINLFKGRDLLLQAPDVKQALEKLNASFNQAIVRLADAHEVQLQYPILSYASEPVALHFDKTPLIQGVLLGIKGQYLLLDTGVINIRKFTGYEVSLTY